jgi:hypothetical protein
MSVEMAGRGEGKDGRQTGREEGKRGKGKEEERLRKRSLHAQGSRSRQSVPGIHFSFSPFPFFLPKAAIH